MFCLSSSPLALKGKLKLTTTISILLVFVLFTLYITSCEARHLCFDGKYSSNEKSSSSKDPTEIGDTKKLTRNSFIVDDTRKKAGVVGSSIGDQSTGAGKALVDRSGGVQNTRNVARISQQLPHRKHRGDQGIHLDYAEPTTRTPYHN